MNSLSFPPLLTQGNDFAVTLNFHLSTQLRRISFVFFWTPRVAKVTSGLTR